MSILESSCSSWRYFECQWAYCRSKSDVVSTFMDEETLQKSHYSTCLYFNHLINF